MQTNHLDLDQINKECGLMSINHFFKNQNSYTVHKLVITDQYDVMFTRSVGLSIILLPNSVLMAQWIMAYYISRMVGFEPRNVYLKT